MLRGLEHETDVVLRRVSPDLDRPMFVREFKKSVNIEILVNNAALLKKTYSRVLFTGISLGFFCQFTGIYSVVRYSDKLFRWYGNEANQRGGVTLIIALIALVLTVVTMFLVDKIGRKRLLIIGSAGMTVCLSLFVIFLGAGLQESWILTVILIGFIAFFAGSQGTIIWVLLAEIYSNEIRMRGISLAAFSYWFFGLAAFYLFPIIADHIGMAFIFGLNAVATFWSILFFQKHIVETKRKTLEEIGKIMTNGKQDFPEF
jgi:MFS family permease